LKCFLGKKSNGAFAIPILEEETDQHRDLEGKEKCVVQCDQYYEAEEGEK
jgi:hypothetical protein